MKYEAFKETDKFKEFKVEYDKLVDSLVSGKDSKEVNKDILLLRERYGIDNDIAF